MHIFCLQLFFNLSQTQEMCNKSVCINPYRLEFVPDSLKTEGVCNKALCMEPYTLRYVLNDLKTQEMSEKAVRIIFPDDLKTECMCNKAVRLIILRHKGCAHAT